MAECPYRSRLTAGSSACIVIVRRRAGADSKRMSFLLAIRSGDFVVTSGDVTELIKLQAYRQTFSGLHSVWEFD